MSCSHSVTCSGHYGLERAIKHRGYVEWPPSMTGTAKLCVCADRLAKLLRSSMEDGAECSRLVLRHVRIAGPLNLTGAGKPGTPVIPFELHECELEGGIDASHAQLQGIRISDCTLLRITEESQKHLRDACGKDADAATLVGEPGKPPQLRFTGATISEKVEVKNLIAPQETILDFSHSTLEHGCELTNIGQEKEPKGNKWGEDNSDAVSCMTFVSAEITGGLTLKGIRVRATCDPFADPPRDGRGLNCTELLLKGSLNLENSRDRFSYILGEFNLNGAEIRGDLRCRGIRLDSLAKNSCPAATLTMEAQGMKVGGSLLFGNFHAHGTPSVGQQAGANDCVISGQIDLDGAHINGDLQVGGTYRAVEHTRMIKAKSVHVGGDVQFGGDGATCLIEGETDFSNATIGGKFAVTKAKLCLKGSKTASPVQSSPDLAADEDRLLRWRKFAVKLFGAHIHGNLVLQGGKDGTSSSCVVEGLGLTGAIVQGQLVIEGVHLRHVPNEEVESLRKEPRKALSANGVTIHGGIFISEEVAEASAGNSQEKRQQSFLDGDVRLRNAKIDGPVILRGVRIITSGGKVAFWAAGTVFGSDFLCQPGECEGNHTDICGEVNLSGATIQGDFKMTGCKLDALGTGTALEAPHLTVSKFAYLGEAVYPFEKQEREGTTTGIVNLNFLTCARLTMGSNPPDPEALPSAKRTFWGGLMFWKQGHGTDHKKRHTHSTDRARLSVTGAILLQGAHVKGPVVLCRLKLLPAEELQTTFEEIPLQAGRMVREVVFKKLQVLSVHRKKVLLSANYAVLGSRLFVRLDWGSDGFISLYGARTGTIGALHSETITNGVPMTVDECWGKVPRQKKGWRAGNPYCGAEPCVTLNLDEFRYDRLFDKMADTDEREDWGPAKLVWGCIGRPLRNEVLPRHQWLRQQVKYSYMPTELVIWPYRQLAKVYRDMGDLQRAYVYERERRWLQIRHGDATLPQRIIDALFGVLFGFGYSSGRAFFWLSLWFGAFSLFLFRFGIGHESVCPSWWQASWPNELYHAASDAIQLLIPDTLKLRSSDSVSHFQQGWPGPAFRGELFGLFVGCFQIFGRIIVIGATLTFTGVLQEKAQVAASVRD